MYVEILVQGKDDYGDFTVSLGSERGSGGKTIWRMVSRDPIWFWREKEKSFEGLVGMEGWRALCNDLNMCVSNGRKEGVVWEETKEIIFHQRGREGESGMNSSHVSSVITRNFSGPGM